MNILHHRVLALLLTGFLIAGVFSARAVLVTASTPANGRVEVPDLALGAPHSPASQPPSSALAIAQRFASPALFAHPHTENYGSYLDPGLGVKSGSAAGRQAVGSRDVWEFTFTGVHIPRPCGPTGGSADCPPPMTTFVIFVDDKAGRVLEAEGF